MPRDNRLILISNLRKKNNNGVGNAVSNDFNQITVTLPNNLISGKLQSANLKNLYIDYEYETIGFTNYQFKISYPSTNIPTTIRLHINHSNSFVVKTDEQLADLIASTINTTLGVTIFNVFYNNIINYSQDVYRDNSNLAATYTIYTSNDVDFNLDFSDINSLGTLIGFGNQVLTSQNSYTSGITPPIYTYEAIKISNAAFNPSISKFDQFTDLSCKMDLYNSNDVLIPNLVDVRDTTISLPIVNSYIYSPSELIKYILTELNKYTSNFAPGTTFNMTYSYTDNKYTIFTNNGELFGIGFRFNRVNGNNYGSLHRVLGFNKQLYLGISKITSIKKSLSFENSYYNDYLLICSDLIQDNFDTSLTISGNPSSLYESLFTIPTTLITQNIYKPVNIEDHYIRIHASMLAKLYNENLPDDKTITFYIKSSTGRHIKINTQWTMELELEYSN